MSMKFIEWWQQREIREKYFLMVGVASLVFILSYLMLEPVVDDRNRMLTEIPRLQTDLDWMQANVNELKSLLTEGGINAGQGKQALSLSSVETFLNKYELYQSVADLSPSANQSIRLEFKEVEYAALMEFLHQLIVKNGARIENARFRRIEGRPGTVDATLTLAQD